MLTEILNVINSRESGVARMLQSDAVIWFQRYLRSDLKRGSISMVRLIAKLVVVALDQLHLAPSGGDSGPRRTST
jgi:hypothetical protein